MRKKYFMILDTTTGCGKRGQHYIDNAYENVLTAFKNLSDVEKQKVNLPSKYMCRDDGTFGIAAGPSQRF